MCGNTCVGRDRYMDAERQMSVVLFVRVVIVLPDIVGMVTGSGAGVGFAITLVIRGLFSVTEMQTIWRAVRTAYAFGRRGQNGSHTQKESNWENDD